MGDLIEVGVCVWPATYNGDVLIKSSQFVIVIKGTKTIKGYIDNKHVKDIFVKHFGKRYINPKNMIKGVFRKTHLIITDLQQLR